MDDIVKTLVEFFRDEFENDAAGVADWLAQGEIDVDEFVAEIDRRFPRNPK